MSTGVDVVKRYTRRRQRAPFRKLKKEEMTEGEKMFETLKEKWTRRGGGRGPRTHGSGGGTWEIIDHRISMRREGRLTQAEGRKLGRRIKAMLKADRIERARQVGEYAVLLLKAGKVREAWGGIWGWHKQVDPKAAKPCFQQLETQTKE